MSSLQFWSFSLLGLYILAMIGVGLYARTRIKNADDFATARGSYSPLFLAFAFAATVASGATFVGFPGIAYSAGISAVWSIILYPAGVYIGVLICMRLIATSGNRFGSRSIPEFLGERFGSDAVRLLVSVFSLLLLFYITGQLVSGIVMFEVMLGLDATWALIVTTGVLLTYIVLGGAHADIMTDGVQGFIMVLLGLVVLVMFLMGAGIEGGLPGLFDNLRAQNANLMRATNPDYALYRAPWSIIAVLLAHIPLGMLPHVGNKLWALKDQRSRKRFIIYAAVMGYALGLLGLGGLLARGMFEGSLESDNLALPLLFIELFPPWLAALLGIGVLSAVMSTADGLVVSSSQILANDFYRRTYVPKFAAHLSEGEVERRTLVLSRIGTLLVILATAFMAWLLMDLNVALLVWIGVGGMMSAFAGPLILGSLWRGVTLPGCVAGLISGLLVFSVLHAGLISPDWFAPGALKSAAQWLALEAPNPFSCAAMGEIVSVLVTWLVSLATKKLPAPLLERVFSEEGEA